MFSFRNIADNIEPEKDLDLYQKFTSDVIDTPDEYLRLLIDKKIARSIDKKRELNPMTQIAYDSLER